MNTESETTPEAIQERAQAAIEAFEAPWYAEARAAVQWGVVHGLVKRPLPRRKPQQQESSE